MKSGNHPLSQSAVSGAGASLLRVLQGIIRGGGGGAAPGQPAEIDYGGCKGMGTKWRFIEVLVEVYSCLSCC